MITYYYEAPAGNWNNDPPYYFTVEIRDQCRNAAGQKLMNTPTTFSWLTASESSVLSPYSQQVNFDPNNPEDPDNPAATIHINWVWLKSVYAMLVQKRFFLPQRRRDAENDLK